jgi:hypothetical protein
MPISLSTTLDDFTNDIYVDQIITNCNNCNCVQLKNLIDPEILYKTAHNITFNLPSWSEHHTEFTKFIIDSNDCNKIMEIGGSSGALYNKLKKHINIEYSCIDLCEPNYDISDIEYIIGNCENYNFKNINCVVMSHLFEHLYEPTNIIKKLSTSNVEYVYISIPNMTKLLEEKSPSILHYEHTYFVDKLLCEYIFSEQGYKLDTYFEFKNHSLFMKFKKTNCLQLPLISRSYISKTILDIYTNIYSRFTEHIVKPNSFIVPGGHMGQLFYKINNLF